MSFVLPGVTRQLRFTGELKAHTAAAPAPTPGNALGRPRTKRQPVALEGPSADVAARPQARLDEDAEVDLPTRAFIPAEPVRFAQATPRLRPTTLPSDSARAQPTVLVHPNLSDETHSANVPLVAWLAGAIIVGVCSYFVVPELVERLGATPRVEVDRLGR